MEESLHTKFTNGLFFFFLPFFFVFFLQVRIEDL